MLKALFRNKKRAFLLIAMFMFAITAGAFAATAATGTLPISSGSSASEGGVADVTPFSDSFTIIQGNAQKIKGHRLCKADLGSSAIRDQVKIFVTLKNPQNISAVLNNPNAWIAIEVTYEVSSGQTYTLSDGKKVKVATLQQSIDNNLTRQNADIMLRPTMGEDSIDTDTYYILGSITVPGGSPPGQQQQLASLTFSCKVRL
jgi:hypothetical protein